MHPAICCYRELNQHYYQTTNSRSSAWITPSNLPQLIASTSNSVNSLVCTEDLRRSEPPNERGGREGGGGAGGPPGDASAVRLARGAAPVRPRCGPAGEGARTSPSEGARTRAGDDRTGPPAGAASPGASSSVAPAPTAASSPAAAAAAVRALEVRRHAEQHQAQRAQQPRLAPHLSPLAWLRVVSSMVGCASTPLRRRWIRLPVR